MAVTKHLSLLLLCSVSLVACTPRVATESIILPNITTQRPSSTDSASSPSKTPLASAEVTETKQPSSSVTVTSAIENYSLPLANPSILQGFNQQNSGLILRTSEAEAAVRAVKDGIVTELSKFSANDGYIVTIQHTDGLSSSYLNLKKEQLIELGSQVRQNQVIGYLGGGSLTPSNVLKFFVSSFSNGDVQFVNPLDILPINP